MTQRRGTVSWVTEQLSDLTGRSPAEIQLFVGAAAVLTCVVVVLRTMNFFADLDSASVPEHSRRRHQSSST
jgi:hypothetical protein